MGKFYILERYHSKSDIFVKDYNDPNNFGEHYIDGKPITGINASTQFYYQYKSNIKTDLLLGIFNFPVVSSRFKEVLKNFEPNNIEFHPVELICQKSGEIDTSYNFLNILNNTPCFNWQSAKYEVSPLAPKVLLGIKTLTIVEEAIKDRHIVRMDEYETIVLISKKLKQMIEKEKLTGIRVIGIEEYGKK